MEFRIILAKDHATLEHPFSKDMWVTAVFYELLKIFFVFYLGYTICLTTAVFFKYNFPPAWKNPIFKIKIQTFKVVFEKEVTQCDIINYTAIFIFTISSKIN